MTADTPSMRLAWALPVLLLALCFAPRAAGAESAMHYDVLLLPGVEAAVDPSATATLADARSGRLSFVPYGRFTLPASASSLRPATIWFKIPAPAMPGAPWYFEGYRYLGRATLYQPGPGGYVATDFGMRVPFAKREVKRTWPTAALQPQPPGTPLYLRASIDLAWLPLSIVNRLDLDEEDAVASRSQRVMFLFSGLFIALGLCNLLVFLSIREAPYALYSISMFILAALGPMQSNALAWELFWPYASVSDMWTRYPALFFEGYISFVFAYLFLRPWEYAPRVNRLCRILIPALPIFDATCIYAFPSVRLSATALVSDFQPVGMTAMFAFFAVVGALALRHGRRSAWFIVAGYGMVALTYGSYTFCTIFANDIALRWAYLVQLGGRAFEGFALFWALVDRLDETIRARSIAEERASTDALTGLANRRVFDVTVEREWLRAQRGETWLAVGMVDIDHFKRYNDTHGHREGDECLRRVAQAIATALNRPDDFAARYGGEEFAIVLPATDSEGALVIAERICDHVRALGRVTVSIGIAAARGNAHAIGDLIDRADNALYRAKGEGRNRVAQPAPLLVSP